MKFMYVIKSATQKEKKPFEKMTNGWFDFCKMARPRSENYAVKFLAREKS